MQCKEEEFLSIEKKKWRKTQQIDVIKELKKKNIRIYDIIGKKYFDRKIRSQYL